MFLNQMLRGRTMDDLCDDVQGDVGQIDLELLNHDETQDGEYMGDQQVEVLLVDGYIFRKRKKSLKCITQTTRSVCILPRWLMTWCLLVHVSAKELAATVGLLVSKPNDATIKPGRKKIRLFSTGLLIF